MFLYLICGINVETVKINKNKKIKIVKKRTKKEDGLHH